MYRADDSAGDDSDDDLDYKDDVEMITVRIKDTLHKIEQKKASNFQLYLIMNYKQINDRKGWEVKIQIVSICRLTSLSGLQSNVCLHTYLQNVQFDLQGKAKFHP